MTARIPLDEVLRMLASVGANPRHFSGTRAFRRPACSHLRKKKFNKCLSIHSDADGFFFRCFHCDEFHGSYRYDDARTTSRRILRSKGDIARAGYKVRNLPGAIVGEKPNRKVVPSQRGNVIAYPFWEHGHVVNEKYRIERDGEKFFWHRKGGKRTFWNVDALDDPLLEVGSQALIITEGIEDGMVAIDSGWPLTVSVPDGAPPVPKDDRLRPLDPETEPHGKYEFLWLNRDRLGRIKRIILAVDNDPPGQRLAAEIVRRVGAGKCLFVSYPEGCKDLNDVRRQLGADAVTDVLRSAR
jgi:Toprim domain